MLSTLNIISFNLYNITKHKYSVSPSTDAQAKSQEIWGLKEVQGHTDVRSRIWPGFHLVLPDLKAHILSILPHFMMLELSYIKEIYSEGSITMDLELHGFRVIKSEFWPQFSHKLPESLNCSFTFTVREMDCKCRSFLSHSKYTIYIALLKYQESVSFLEAGGQKSHLPRPSTLTPLWRFR